MARYYYEVATFGGRWTPQVSNGLPKTVTSGGVTRLTDGTGKRLRAAPVEVPASYDRLTLDQLAQVIGPDGRFTAGQINQGGE